MEGLAATAVLTAAATAFHVPRSSGAIAQERALDKWTFPNKKR